MYTLFFSQLIGVFLLINIFQLLNYKIMKREFTLLSSVFLIMLLLFFNTQAGAQVSGYVFKDYNGNGTKENITASSSSTVPYVPAYNELFLAGVIVRAYDPAGNLLTTSYGGGGSSTNAATGSYSITGGTLGQIRLEFILPAGDIYATKGAAGGTTIMFPTTATQNLAVNIEDEYRQANPLVVTTKFLAQRATTATNFKSIVRMPYNIMTDPDGNTNGTTVQNTSFPGSGVVTYTPDRIDPDSVANIAQTGAIWGLAYNKRTKKLYSATYVKRGARLSALSNESTGAIFVTDDAVTPSPTTIFVDLNTVFGANTAGVNPHPFATTDWFTDVNAITSVGKVGFGDIDVSKDGTKLYAINLADRKLYVIPTTGPLNSTTITRFDVPTTGLTVNNSTGGTTTADPNDIRPFGIGIDRNGDVYVGAVHSAETVSAGPNTDPNPGAYQLHAFVWRFNQSTGTFSAPVLSESLRFSRDGGTPPNNYSTFDDPTSTPRVVGSDWEPWSNLDAIANQQPMLSDIDFFDGRMVLGFRDRGSDLSFGGDQSSGDIYLASPVGAIWELESAGVSGGLTAGIGTTNNQGPGGGEFFEDLQGDGVPNAGIGGVAILPGSGVLSSATDAVIENSLGGRLSNFGAAGIQTHSFVNGDYIGGYDVYYKRNNVIEPGSFSKAGGVGDVEVLFDVAAIEIGNRVWNDTDGDGIQDGGETGIGSVLLELFNPATNTVVGTVTTAADGSYFFSNATGTNVAGATYGLVIDTSTNYIIRLATTGVGNDWDPTANSGAGGPRAGSNLDGYSLTLTDVTSPGIVNGSDNDASLVSSIPQISITTGNYGQNNHTYDIGFTQQIPPPAIGNKVWLDDGTGGGTAGNGIQDGTEPGISGVTVTLYQNGTDGLPGTADDIVVGTTITDALGEYYFGDLIPPSTNAATAYNVGFTAPANHQFTTQTNTQVTGTSNATNTTTTTGGATAANGSDANAITGRTGSFWLIPGEKDFTADAGFILGIPPLTNSIGDKVWFDNGLGGGAAGDGIQNGMEPGIAGVTVTLYASDGVTVIATTITDANGNYQFSNLTANTNYIIGVTLPAGMVFSTQDLGGNDNNDSDVNPATGKTTAINTGVAGTQITNVDAGIKSQPMGTASLGDKVWNDVNNNGTQDAGEPGIAGVTVRLYEDVNGDSVLTGAELTPVRTTTTDAFGNYVFNDLLPTSSNRWQVEFVQPSGYTNTAVANNNSGGDATDSDIEDDVTDRTAIFILKADQREMNVDAGFVQTMPAGALKLGDKVWRDSDADGIQDTGEPGVAGVTVALYRNGADGLPGTADDVLVTTTTTDANGNYLFPNLAASTSGTASTYYNVQFSNIPADFMFTTQTNTQNAAGTTTNVTGGATAANGSDANTAGKTGSFNLQADNVNVDAGIKQGISSGLASIGDKVWYDLNGNGVQDAGELGVAGVTATLKDGSGNDIDSDPNTAGVQPTVATTNALGEYIFTKLPAGTYSVVFSNMPIGYIISPRDAATGTDATDSDGSNAGTTIAAVTISTTDNYTLGVGEENLTVDLGIRPPTGTNTLGNYVWYDLNSDGLQADEPQVRGVMVTLVNAAGQPVDRNGVVLTAGAAPVTTTTDVNGQYLFTGLADATFAVKFNNIPTGFSLTTQEVTNTTSGGSDADRTTGITGTVTFPNDGIDRNNTSLDAGLISSKSAIGNRVWDDVDGDGIQDAGEPGIPGVEVILYAANGTTVLSSAITDANGNYLFTNLNAGTYVLGIDNSTLTSGSQPTVLNNTTGPDGDGDNNWTGGGDNDFDPATNKTAPIVLASGQSNLTVDAGIRKALIATVGNRVWDDIDGNGLQDPGEPGIPGVVATLYNSDNEPVGSAITGNNGEWLITNVPPGTGYYVVFSNQPIGTWTSQDNGGAGTGGATDIDTDSDVDVTGRTGAFDVTSNDVTIKVDAGLRQAIALSVEFTSFTVAKVNKTAVLQFTISEASPASIFTIERSIDGVNFIGIATISATNNVKYSYTDINPVSNKLNYYRIKEVLPTGKIIFTAIQSLLFNNTNGITIYPIPASSNISIVVSDALVGKPLQVTLYNNAGSMILRKQVLNNNGTAIIDVSKMASGSYVLQLTDGNTLVKAQAVLVQH
jgi:hypothetical protein